MIALIPLDAWQATVLVVMTLALLLPALTMLLAGLGWLVRWWRLRGVDEELDYRAAAWCSAIEKECAPPARFKAPPLRPAPARFIGWQDGFGVMEPFALYNLTEALPGYPKGTTVSRHTLEQLGYIVPPAPYQFGAAAERQPFLARRTGAEGAVAAP